MKAKTHRPLLSLAALSLLFAASTQAALLVDYDLGGNQSTTIWTNLTSGNSGLSPDSGTGTLTVASPGFAASSGLYSFAGDYSITVAQGSADIHNVVFQVDAAHSSGSWPDGVSPLLSINGSAETLAATWFAIGDSEERSSGGPTPLTYTGYSWQWDLSSYGETITSVSILTPLASHSSVAAARIDVADQFVEAIPEPSAMLLSFVSLGLLARRRR